MNSYKSSFIILISFLAIACSRQELAPDNIQVQSFIWRGLNAYYLWQDKVPDLSDRRFNNDQELYNYLEGFSDPNAFFYNTLLYLPNEFPKDPNKTYSWIVDDYIALEQAFNSIRTTTGMKLKAANFTDGSGGYYVYVYDVAKNSDAEAKGVTRGMLITQVNGTTLTPNNVSQLFANNSFTIHLADYNMGNPETNGITINLTKTQLTENPVKETKVITNGSNTIGYLLYNQFSSAFDADLNAAFATFKTENITDLVLDLRYNGGGSVQTAVYLGGMITGQFNNQLFAKEVWNTKVQNAFSVDKFSNNFTNIIENKDANGTVILSETINSLNLNKLHVIVSSQTASASELIINALKPYIEVVLIGEQTYGKHVGSITLYDSDNYSRTGANLNTSHTWAMQPIVLEIQNKNGENKPNGFIVDIPMVETPENLGILGDPTEPLLERTIEYITTGAKGASLKATNTIHTAKWNSSITQPDYANMYVTLK